MTAAKKEKFADDIYRLEDKAGHLMRCTYKRPMAILIDWLSGTDIKPMKFAAPTKLADEGQLSQNYLGWLTAEAVGVVLSAGRNCVRTILAEGLLFSAHLSLKGRNETINDDAGLPTAGDAA